MKKIFQLRRKLSLDISRINLRRILSTSINTILILLSFIVFLGSISGRYYKREFIFDKIEMFPTILVIILLLLIRHLLKSKDVEVKKPDRLYRRISDKRSIALLLLIVLAFSFFLMYKNSWDISRDAFLHYVYLRSLYFDGDLDFTNDYERIQGSTYFVNHETGYWMNPFSIGSSILWFPFFFVGHKIGTFLNLPSDGYSEFPYHFSLCFAGLFLAWIGLIILVKSLRRFFRDSTSVIISLIIWWATPLTFYTNQQPSMSHPLSFFASSVFLYIFLLIEEKQATPRWIWLGICGGIIMLVRPQNAIFLLIPVIFLVRALIREFKKEQKKEYFRLIYFGTIYFLFIAVSFIPQMIVWQIMYKSPITVPQGKDFMEWSNPKILEVLFSTNHGLFSWTPILIFGFLGFIIFYRRAKLISLSFAAVSLITIYINSVPNDWWGGYAFGARRFISLLPYLAFGMASLFEWEIVKKWYRWTLIAVIVFAFLWNTSLISLYTNETLPHSGTIPLNKFIFPTVVKMGNHLLNLPALIPKTCWILTHKNSSWHLYNLRLKNETTLIEMGQESRYLRNGWSEIRLDPGLGKRVRVSIRDISSIHFFTEPSDLKMEIRIFPLFETKWVTPVINSTSLAPIELKPGWQTIEIPIKSEKIRSGLNIFRLDSYWLEPQKNKIILKSQMGEFIEVEWIKILFHD